MCRLQNDSVRTRLPIQKGMLHIILRKIGEIWCDQPYLVAMYQAIYSTMYYGLLRVSEVAGPQHAVKAGDIQVGTNKEKFLSILRTSKTHWRNVKPQLIKISARRSKNSDADIQSKLEDEFCPYTLLDRYSKMRGPFRKKSDPFFVLSDGSGVTPYQVCNTLKLVIKLAGFNPNLYSSHSTRVGRSTDIAKYGLSVETIKKLGRWRSNAVFRYLRD